MLLLQAIKLLVSLASFAATAADGENSITDSSSSSKCTDDDCQHMIKASVCDTERGQCACRIGDRVSGSPDSGNPACSTVTCHATADCYPKGQQPPSANETTLVCSSDSKCICDPARLKLAGHDTTCVPLDDGSPLASVPVAGIIGGAVLFLLIVALLIWCAWFGPTICHKAKEASKSGSRKQPHHHQQQRSSKSVSRRKKGSRKALKASASKRRNRSVSVSRRQKVQQG